LSAEFIFGNSGLLGASASLMLQQNVVFSKRGKFIGAGADTLIHSGKTEISVGGNGFRFYQICAIPKNIILLEK
jgi:hypothetical protein